MSTTAFLVAVLFLGFWAVGAYNRLTRLGAVVRTAYAALAKAIEARSALLLKLAHGQLIHQTEPHHQSVWHRLERCLQQATNAAAHAAIAPLSAQRIDALAVAQASLLSAWLVVQESVVDLAGPPWPPQIQLDLALCDARILSQREEFNSATGQYNAAVGQFPALVLAWVFNMPKGKPLPVSP